ncbi:hypothetical protein CLF_110613 [Clonorchis sinensis]|uniref:CCHC-type domain-containing protein n=1 Tax=Clonorchis sinensis TaxID=79923 RepID=G7YTQ0_CLOSI|nr:hypothetical protein CLF_110613 [Clonorchis sinensis]
MRAFRDEQDRQIQLMKGDNDVEAARLMCILSCSEDESRADDQPISAPSRFQPHPKRLTYQCGMTPPKGISKRNNERCTAGNHTLAPLIASMDLPRVKLTKFDGSSHDYLKFIRQFEFYVESRTADDGQKWLCLLHYCRGRVREATEECTKWAEDVDGVTRDERKPMFRDLRNFMDIRERISNSRCGTIADQTNKYRAAQTTQPKQPIKRQHSFVNAVFKTPESCPLCREPHPLTNCKKFAEFECSKRWDVAKGCKVCFRCLKAGHLTKACNTERKCGVNKCKARHLYLLHTTLDPPRSVQGTCNAANARQRSAALSFLPVRIKVPLGELAVYALLDHGSDTTLVSHDVFQKLGIPPHPSQLTIKTISGYCLSESCVENLEIGSLLDSTSVNIEKALVVPSIMPSVESHEALARLHAHLDDLPITDIPRKLCRTGLGWDTPIDQSCAKEWTNLVDFVTSLGKIRQPRRIFSMDVSYRGEAELHLFSDASETGYGVAA